jgi:hypothetical protein
MYFKLSFFSLKGILASENIDGAELFQGGKIERDFLGIYWDLFFLHKLLNQVGGVRSVSGEAKLFNLDFAAFFFEIIIFQAFF